MGAGFFSEETLVLRYAGSITTNLLYFRAKKYNRARVIELAVTLSNATLAQQN
jgi:hypothetical protein